MTLEALALELAAAGCHDGWTLAAKKAAAGNACVPIGALLSTLGALLLLGATLQPVGAAAALAAVGLGMGVLLNAGAPRLWRQARLDRRCYRLQAVAGG